MAVNHKVIGSNPVGSVIIFLLFRKIVIKHKKVLEHMHSMRALTLPYLTPSHHTPPPIYAGIVTDSCFRLSELSRATSAAFPR